MMKQIIALLVVVTTVCAYVTFDVPVRSAIYTTDTLVSTVRILPPSTTNCTDYLNGVPILTFVATSSGINTYQKTLNLKPGSNTDYIVCLTGDSGIVAFTYEQPFDYGFIIVLLTLVGLFILALLFARGRG